MGVMNEPTAGEYAYSQSMSNASEVTRLRQEVAEVSVRLHDWETRVEGVQVKAAALQTALQWSSGLNVQPGKVVEAAKLFEGYLRETAA